MSLQSTEKMEGFAFLVSMSIEVRQRKVPTKMKDLALLRMRFIDFSRNQ